MWLYNVNQGNKQEKVEQRFIKCQHIQSINQSINFYGGLSNKQLPQGPHNKKVLI